MINMFQKHLSSSNLKLIFIASKLPPLPKTGIAQSELLRARRRFDRSATLTAALRSPTGDKPTYRAEDRSIQ